MGIKGIAHGLLIILQLWGAFLVNVMSHLVLVVEIGQCKYYIPVVIIFKQSYCV